MEMEDTDFLDYCMKNLVEDNEAKDGDEAEDVDEFENDEKIDTLWPFDSNGKFSDIKMPSSSLHFWTLSFPMSVYEKHVMLLPMALLLHIAFATWV